MNQVAIIDRDLAYYKHLRANEKFKSTFECRFRVKSLGQLIKLLRFDDKIDIIIIGIDPAQTRSPHRSFVQNKEFDA